MSNLFNPFRFMVNSACSKNEVRSKSGREERVLDNQKSIVNFCGITFITIKLLRLRRSDFYKESSLSNINFLDI